MIENNRITLMEKARMVAYYVAYNDNCNTMKIQRQFSLNFNLICDIIDILEKLGIVSEFNFEKSQGRMVLVDSIDELEEKLDFYF